MIPGRRIALLLSFVASSFAERTLTSLKCCPEGQALTRESGCREATSEDVAASLRRVSRLLDALGFPVRHGMPNCSEGSTRIFIPEGEFEHAKNGSLRTAGGFRNEYCSDTFVLNNSTIPLGVLVCTDLSLQGPSCPWRKYLYSCFALLSTLFLLTTSAVYLGIRELRHKMHHLFLLSEMAAQVVYNVGLTLNNVAFQETSLLCRLVGTMTQFAYLASYFWLTLLCYHCWKTLRSYTSAMATEITERSKLLTAYLTWSLFGWGGPLVITTAGVVLDEVANQSDGNLISHGIKEFCFIRASDVVAHWVHLYGISLLLCLVNIFFFLHIGIELWKRRREMKKHLGSPDSKMSLGRRPPGTALYFKLFLLMGISMILDIVSYPFQTNYCQYWAPFDVLNLSRGIIIFLIFVCNQRITALVCMISDVTEGKIASKWCSNRPFAASFCLNIGKLPLLWSSLGKLSIFPKSSSGTESTSDNQKSSQASLETAL